MYTMKGVSVGHESSQNKTKPTQKIISQLVDWLKDSSWAFSVLLMISSFTMSLPVEANTERKRKHCGKKQNRKFIQINRLT